MLESEIKKKCKADLEKAGWLVIHLIQTSQNGVPDTLAIHPIKGYRFIEFKQLGKNPRPLQEYRIMKLRQYGAIVLVVRSQEDIKDLLS